jgi:ABC-type Fe3+/spermidine/putrescine transport system ATPase subunit
MSDRIAVMDHGIIVQLGSPAELYEKPRTRFVAQFLGGCNLLPVTVRERHGPDILVQTPVGDLRLATNDSRNAFTLAIRPEKIVAGNGSANQCTGEVVDTTYTGAETHCTVRVGQEILRVVTVNAANGLRLQRGAQVQLTLPREALIVLED